MNRLNNKAKARVGENMKTEFKNYQEAIDYLNQFNNEKEENDKDFCTFAATVVAPPSFAKPFGILCASGESTAGKDVKN